MNFLRIIRTIVKTAMAFVLAKLIALDNADCRIIKTLQVSTTVVFVQEMVNRVRAVQSARYVFEYTVLYRYTKKTSTKLKSCILFVCAGM